jgi:hypothetical protein
MARPTTSKEDAVGTWTSLAANGRFWIALNRFDGCFFEFATILQQTLGRKLRNAGCRAGGR